MKKQNKYWSVVIGQKGSIVLPKEMVAFAGAYTVYDLSVMHRLSGGKRGRKVYTYIELAPRFAAFAERSAVTSRRRLYIGRALSVLGFDEALLRQTPRELRSVQLALMTGAHTPSGVVYRIDVTDMVNWQRKRDRLGHETAALGHDLNRAAERGARAGSLLRRIFLASRRYLLAEGGYGAPPPKGAKPPLPGKEQ